MPNKKSAKKALKQSKSLALKNGKEKNQLKELAKKILKAVEAGKADEAKTLSQKFQKLADKAAKSWLKPNTASRQKSRLAKKVKAVSKK